MRKSVERNLAVKVDSIRPLSKGASRNYLISSQGEEYVVKTVGGVTTIPPLHRRVIDRLFQKNLPDGYRDQEANRDPLRRLNCEIDVLERWSNEKIPAIPVHKTDRKEMIMLPYLPSTTHADLIRQGNYTTQDIDALVETLNQIREAAFKHDDSKYLHNDFHLDNILRPETSSQAIAIDPGLVLREELGLRKLDALVNLFFLYSLQNPSIYPGEETREVREETTRATLSSMNSDSLKEMRDRNEYLNPLYLAYHRITAGLKRDKAHRDWFLTFRRENFENMQRNINDALRK